MHTRNLYIKKVRPFIGKPIVKVITGMRRTGKSCFLQLIMNELQGRKVNKQNIVYINKESLDYDFIQDYKSLNRYVKDAFAGVTGNKYLFMDEVQEIEKWEKAVSSFFSGGDIDVFITGSNAHLLSSDIATLLSGRYIEIPVYSLSFEEFLQFREPKTAGKVEEFSTYLWAGGFPAIHHFDFNREVVYQYIASIYNTILLKDIIKRNNIRNVSLLENITHYIFNNIGNIFTAKKVSDYLKSQRLRVSVETVQNYISHLTSTFAVFKVPRFDVKGKRLLEIHEKYYLGDVSLRHALLGYREGDISGVLENLVFLELKRRGYQVYVGKFDNREIDFIAEKENRKIYIQVAYLLESQQTIEREFSVLKSINDNYPKYVISMDDIFGRDVEGIQRINLVDFLLDPEI